MVGIDLHSSKQMRVEEIAKDSQVALIPGAALANNPDNQEILDI